MFFSQWTKLLDIAEELLHIINISFLRIDGGVNVDERQTIIDTFGTNDIKYKFIYNSVLLLSSRACGVGINCIAADTVIIHDLEFNPQMDIQAEDRCHRIGQTKPVNVYHLVTINSVDEDVKKHADEKRNLCKSIFTDEDDEYKAIESVIKKVLGKKKGN